MASETDLRDQLAVNRTQLANERTLLAYLRTGLALIASGAGLLEFGGTLTARWVGGILIGLGVLAFPLGIWRFLSIRRQLRQHR